MQRVESFLVVLVTNLHAFRFAFLHLLHNRRNFQLRHKPQKFVSGLGQIGRLNLRLEVRTSVCCTVADFKSTYYIL